jgi:hypothetical protein
MDYAQNFQTKYLDSEYGHLFLAHDNNSLFRGESIISFRTEIDNAPAESVFSTISIPNRRKSIEQERILMSPQESRQTFIRERIRH